VLQTKNLKTQDKTNINIGLNQYEQQITKLIIEIKKI